MKGEGFRFFSNVWCVLTIEHFIQASLECLFQSRWQASCYWQRRQSSQNLADVDWDLSVDPERAYVSVKKSDVSVSIRSLV